MLVGPAYVLLAQDFTLAVEPHDLILGLEDRVVVLVNVFVHAAGGCRRHRPTGPVTARLAEQFAYGFVGIADLHHGCAAVELRVVVIGPRERADDRQRNQKKDASRDHYETSLTMSFAACGR